MKDSDVELSKWKQEREKGRVWFVIHTSFPAILGVMIGRSIEPVLLSDEAWSWTQTTDILTSGLWASAGAIPVSFIVWWWREKKSKRHISRFEDHT